MEDMSEHYSTSVVKVGTWTSCKNYLKFVLILILVVNFAAAVSPGAVHRHDQDLTNTRLADDFAVRPVSSAANPFHHDNVKVARSANPPSAETGSTPPVHGERPVASSANCHGGDHLGAEPSAPP